MNADDRRYVVQQIARLEARLDGTLRANDARWDAMLSRIDSVRNELAAAAAASEKATQKADTATERRFEATNEFRAQLADQVATFLPREVYDPQHEALVGRVAALELSSASTSGRSGGVSSSFGVIIAVIVGVAAILGIVSVLANVLTSQ